MRSRLRRLQDEPAEVGLLQQLPDGSVNLRHVDDNLERADSAVRLVRRHLLRRVEGNFDTEENKFILIFTLVIYL